jgi:tetratricopeptide (TPR) repeat protein
MRYALTALVICFLVSAPAVSNPSDTPAARAETPTTPDIPDAECRRALGIMFSGLPGDAAEYIDSLEPRYDRGPLYRLTRARIYREVLPVDDENKDRLKEMAEPIYADLEIAIAECDRRLEAGEDNPRLLLYRGWAWMFKSHIRTFERSFWTAGRDAKRGRNDLRDYLELHPNDPIANGIMGTFLYFADTLPAAFKFLSKLLFMPTGDREEGLRMMVTACAQQSLIEVDNKTLLFSVYIAFEGRYEDGLEGFARLHRRYPDYPVFVRPLALTLPFTPRDRERAEGVLERMLDDERNATAIGQDPGPYNMLRFASAYADRFYDPESARRRFEALVERDPAHPDWVTSFCGFELARQLAARGDRDGARRRLRAVLEDESGAYLHGEARSMLDELEEDYATSGVGDVPVVDIYRGDRAAVARVASALRSTERFGVQADFYLGEALLALGDDDGAITSFRSAIDREVPMWDEAFQLIACSRLAEIHGSRLQYEEAAHYLDMAPQFYHKEFLFDWLFEGRKRFYERVASGELVTTPTLFSRIP